MPGNDLLISMPWSPGGGNSIIWQLLLGRPLFLPIMPRWEAAHEQGFRWWPECLGRCMWVSQSFKYLSQLWWIFLKCIWQLYYVNSSRIFKLSVLRNYLLISIRCMCSYTYSYLFINTPPLLLLLNPMVCVLNVSFIQLPRIAVFWWEH